MSMNFERDSSDKSVTEQEGVLFAQPVWERRSKKRGVFGRKIASTTSSPTIAPEPRSFAAERDDETLAQPPLIERPIEGAYPLRDDYIRPEGAGYGATTPPTNPTRIEDDASLVAPIGRPATRTTGGARSNSMGPAAIAAGVVTLGALGAVGWYASRSNDGVPELAAGQPAGEQLAVAPTAPIVPAVAPPSDMSVNPPTAAAPPRVSVPASAPVRTARARPDVAASAAPSAGDTGVNASTTAALPSGPQPYSTLNPGAAPPAPVTPPATMDAAPAPTEAPAVIPETPPVESPAPTEAAPETTVTPPTS